MKADGDLRRYSQMVDLKSLKVLMAGEQRLAAAGVPENVLQVEVIALPSPTKTEAGVINFCLLNMLAFQFSVIIFSVEFAGDCLFRLCLNVRLAFCFLFFSCCASF